MLTDPQTLIFVTGKYRQADEVIERGISQLSPESDLLFEESDIVMPNRREKGGMAGGISLDNNRPLQLSPPRSSANLGDDLEGVLGGPEIGQGERGIGHDHADQSHIRKIKPLGDHLGANQNINPARFEFIKYNPMRIPGADRVGIHPPDPGLRKDLLYLLFYPLGSPAGESDIFRLAERTSPVRRSGITAEMADLPAITFMIS